MENMQKAIITSDQNQKRRYNNYLHDQLLQKI